MRLACGTCLHRTRILRHLVMKPRRKRHRKSSFGYGSDLEWGGPVVTSQAPGRRQRTEPGRDGLNRLIIEGLRHAAHDEVVGGVMRQVLAKAREPRDEIRRDLPRQHGMAGILPGVD